jgi:hypothetical protein
MSGELSSSSSLMVWLAATLLVFALEVGCSNAGGLGLCVFCLCLLTVSTVVGTSTHANLFLMQISTLSIS